MSTLQVSAIISRATPREAAARSAHPIPSPRRADQMIPPRDDELAVGGECHALDWAGQPPEGEGLLSRLNIPHPHCLVKAPRDDARAVGAEAHAQDGAGVSLE